MNYRVSWEIDEETDEGPVAAAKEAFKHMQRPGTTANVFSVKSEDGKEVTVDLEDYKVEEEHSTEAERFSNLMRWAFIYAYNLSYKDFLRVMGIEDDYYAKGEFSEMRDNFSKWFCSLDSENAKKFCQEVING